MGGGEGGVQPNPKPNHTQKNNPTLPDPHQEPAIDRYHQQVAAGHTDDADIRKGFQDVIQGGGGEGEHFLGGILGDALMNHLWLQHKAKFPNGIKSLDERPQHRSRGTHLPSPTYASF